MSMPASTELPWKPYPSRVKQDDLRRRVDQVTLKILRTSEVVGWKLVILEEMYPEDNMP
jgi:hypothetical protein